MEPNGSRNAATTCAASVSPWLNGRVSAALCAVWMVTVLVALAAGDTESWLGEKVQVASEGRPLQLKLTLPLKLLVGAALTMNCVEAPAATVAVCVEALRPNVAAPLAVGLFAMAAKSPWAAPLRPAVK